MIIFHSTFLLNLNLLGKRVVNVYVRGVLISNPGPTKSYTALQTIRPCFNIYTSSYDTLALSCGKGNNSLHVLA